MKTFRDFLLFLIPFLSTGVYGQNLTTDASIRFVNYGQMNVAENTADPARKTASLYIPNSLSAVGSNVEMVQNGITALGGNFNNDVTSGNLFHVASTGIFRFSGTSDATQEIIQLIQGEANRQTHYIDFPHIEVAKLTGYVRLVSHMGMNTDNLNLTSGKLQLYSTLADVPGSFQSQVANLLVNGTVTYNREAALSLQQKGVVEVLLALPTAQADRKERFFAFSSPFKTMYADYFSYCMLGRPTNEGLFGPSKTSIWQAEHPLKSGEGYVVGQDVFNDDEEYYKNRPQYSSASFNHRLGNLLTLNRYDLDINSSSINITKNTMSSTAYGLEEIQTDDVPVNLAPGFNYLGNPYTAPLDISTLLDDNNGSDSWGISRSQTNDGTQLYAAVYVMDQMTSTVTNVSQHKFKVGASWLTAQKVGGTYTIDPSREGAGVLIAPMQLFAVWNESGTTMTIPKSQRLHGNANFLRNSNEPVDEVLLEVVDADNKGYDRMCVVFRPDASLKAGDPYDAYKMFNNSGKISQIYNRSIDGSDMAVNVVPSSLKSMTISLTPADQAKEVTLNAYRLNSLVSIQDIWLEDLKTNKTIDLIENESYTFQTQPNDAKERFVLHFSKSMTEIDELNSSLHLSYNNSLLTISGISNADAGSILSVFDLQGRLIQSSRLPKDTGSTFTTRLQVQEGIYLVKIAGKRNLTSKLICK